jgi:peptide deformylase
MIPLPGSLAIDYYERHLENRICRPVLPHEFLEMPTTGTKTKLELLADQMYRFSNEKDGYAIAAPQVGLYIRLVVLTYPRKMVLVNPNISRLAGNDLFEPEACLSLPPNTAEARVTRCSMVDFTYQDVTGKQNSATFTELAARIIQHEVDHLDGGFFINRINSPIALAQVMEKYRTYMRDIECQPRNSLKRSSISSMQQR